MKPSIIIGAAKRMQSGFLLAMSRIFQDQQRLVKENLLGLCLANAMPDNVFSFVASVPLKSSYRRPTLHTRILPAYTRRANKLTDTLP
jgi:hypothetical protein